MRVHALELLDYDQGVARLALDVGSGTYVRSIADALGGHCVELRRTSVGPFTVDEADDDHVLGLDEALERVERWRAA
jgi:tRNA U55 pseudouridine synthase TruB